MKDFWGFERLYVVCSGCEGRHEAAREYDAERFGGGALPELFLQGSGDGRAETAASASEEG